MNPDVYLYISGAAIVCFGIYHFFLSKRSVIHGIIRKAPRKRIAEVLNGETVSVQGKIVCAGRHMKAPLSGRTCVYYHVKVVDSSSRRELLRNYIDLEEEKVADICIQDGESYAVIDTRLIAHYVIHDEEQHSGFWSATSPELKQFLKKHGEPSDWMGWSLDLFAREGVLEEGEVITVAGKANWRDVSDFKLKIPASRVLFIQPLNEHGVYLTDDPCIHP